MKRKFYIILLVIFIVLVSCEKTRTYHFATGPESTSYYQIGSNISQVVKDANPILLDLLKPGTTTLPMTAINNIQLLLSGEAEFVITQNDVRFTDNTPNLDVLNQSDIRTVMPLFPEIFFVIYRSQLQPQSLQDLMVGKNVGMGPEDSGTSHFAETFFANFGIEKGQYKPIYRDFSQNVFSDSVDVVCLLTGFNNNRIKRMLQQGGKIYSFDHPDLVGNGSAIDGFCLNYPLARPYVLPKGIHGNLPENPILTVAVDAVLLTHKNVPVQDVYAIMETILEQKQYMATRSGNELISQITEDFVPSNLRFPLHSGARKYLDRNQPGFLERYAELAGFIFSIMLAIFGGVSTLAQWRKRRRKNRIDDYYTEVLKYDKFIKNYKTVEECQNAIIELKELRNAAFQLLIAEKLTADESFRIFITLLNETIVDLRRKQNLLK